MQDDHDMQKITVEIPRRLLDDAKEYTGLNMSDTVREGLRRLAQMQAQRQLLELRFTPSVAVEEMRGWEDR